MYLITTYLPYLHIAPCFGTYMKSLWNFWDYLHFLFSLYAYFSYADYTRIVWQSFVEAWKREVCGTFPGAWNNTPAWVYQLQEALGPVQQCGQPRFHLSDLSRGGSSQVPSKYCTD